MQLPAWIRQLFLCSTLLLAACGEGHAPSGIAGKAFGTTWRLKIARAPSPAEAEALQSGIQRDLDRWGGMISHWKPESDLSRFNAATTTDWQPMPAELIELIRIAEDVAKDTGGALDITLAPLIDLWGFGAAGRRSVPPSEAEIERARAACGWSKIEIRDNPPALRKTHPATRLNLSAVAEGWALDRLATRLESAGEHDFLLELGGEVLARGHAADGRPWLVAVQVPDAPVGETLPSFRLEDAALATSGTYRQRFEFEGKTFSHVLDPRTGRPVAHALKSVSTQHASAALADGYATALLVLGPEEGRAAAEKLGLNVLWLE